MRVLPVSINEIAGTVFYVIGVCCLRNAGVCDYETELTDEAMKPDFAHNQIIRLSQHGYR